MTWPACLTRLTNILALVAFGAAAGHAQAAEATYPTRPVRLVIGFPPGGSIDVLARLISPKLSNTLGQNWIVDNRGGAGGNLATEIVARADPDGHTVLLALNTQLTANPSLYKLAFNVEKALQPVTLLAMFEFILVVHPSVQAKTLQQLVALAKQKPRAFNYASCGVGCTFHLNAELLKKRAGIDMVHVAYKGTGPAVAGMLAGEAQVLIGAIPSAMPHVTAGRLRALATSGAKRNSVTPELPTIAESGYPGFEIVAWYGLLVPSASPKAIAERIRSEALKALQQPDVQTTMVNVGLEPATSTPDQLAARIRSETTTWAGIISEAGIRAE